MPTTPCIGERLRNENFKPTPMASILNLLTCCLILSAFVRVETTRIVALFLFESKHVDPLLILLLPAVLATTFLEWRGRADDIQYAAVIGFAIAMRPPESRRP